MPVRRLCNGEISAPYLIRFKSYRIFPEATWGWDTNFWSKPCKMAKNWKCSKLVKNWYFFVKFGQDVYFIVRNQFKIKNFEKIENFPIFPDFPILPKFWRFCQNWTEISRSGFKFWPMKPIVLYSFTILLYFKTNLKSLSWLVLEILTLQETMNLAYITDNLHNCKVIKA